MYFLNAYKAKTAPAVWTLRSFAFTWAAMRSTSRLPCWVNLRPPSPDFSISLRAENKNGPRENCPSSSYGVFLTEQVSL